MDFADALRVVQRRGQAMQQASDATPSGMVSVLLLDRDKVESIRGRAAEAGVIEFANFLCPGNLVLSGEKAACAKAEELADYIRRLRAEDPNRPIYIVAKSGGTGLALLAAELLPANALERIVLLSAAR